MNAIAKAQHNNQEEPRVTLHDVYGESGSYVYEPTFWELVLCCQIFDRKINITRMAYDQRNDGLYENNPQPLIDFKILDKELVSQAAQMPPQATAAVLPADIVTERTTSSPDTVEARVFMENVFVCVAVTGDKTYKIAKLGRNQSYYRFMRYLLEPENTDIDITIDEIKNIQSLRAASNLGELARRSGFNNTLKGAFFPTSSATRIRFRAVAQLSQDQIDAVKKQAAKLDAKNRE